MDANSVVHLFNALDHLKLLSEASLVTVCAAIVLLSANAAKSVIDKSRIGNRRRNRAFALNAMDTMPDSEFKIMFRMDRTSFNILQHRLEDHIGEPTVEEVRQSMRSSGSPISTKSKLAVTIRWLAGGSYLSTAVFTATILWNTLNGVKYFAF